MYPYYEKENSYIYTDICSDFNFPPHLHSSIEFFYVLEGMISIEVNDQQYQLPEGSCILIFPNKIHRYVSEGNKNKGFLLLFNQSVAGTFLQTFRQYHPISPVFPAETLSPDIKLAVTRLLNSNIINNSALTIAWIQLILANLLSECKLLKNTGNDSDALISQIIQYIMKHFKEPLTLKKVANSLYISEHYLSHSISKYLHLNFREYLNGVRLDYAIQVIHSSTLTISQIWELSGFESQATFNRVFQKHFHMSPSQYRKNLHAKVDKGQNFLLHSPLLSDIYETPKSI